MTKSGLCVVWGVSACVSPLVVRSGMCASLITNFLSWEYRRRARLLIMWQRTSCFHRTRVLLLPHFAWHTRCCLLQGMLPIYRPLYPCTLTPEGFIVFTPSRSGEAVPCVIPFYKFEGSKGISAVIPWRKHAVLERFKWEPKCSDSACVGAPFFMLSKKGSQTDLLIFAQETRYRAGVGMQVSLVSVSASGIFFTWLRCALFPRKLHLLRK